jgi:hypothetical protein
MTHPSTLDHSPQNLRRLSEACREAAEAPWCDFDDMQDAANALLDWAMLREGVNLIGLDGVEYPLPITLKESSDG